MTEFDRLEKFKAGFVAVAGRPNVGKSTLINTILGQKIAAVSPRPQTTRKQQLGIFTNDEVQIVFTDTPGIHQAKHKLGSYMNTEAEQALGESDVILFVVDASEVPDEEDVLIAEILEKTIRFLPIILVLNKVDLVDGEKLEANIEEFKKLLPEVESVRVSAMHGNGVDDLLAMITSHLPVHPPFFPEDQVTDAYEREIAADLIREATLLILRDEVPHSIAVRIDEYTPRGDDGANIEATLFVERDSQKGIVIGKGGARIKQIGIHARKEIEAMSGRTVFLRLRVKVRKNWRNDDKTLRSFGFQGKGKK